jgi:predicted phosphodiesterase
MTQKKWTIEEEQKLADLVGALGHKWLEIGERLGRTSDSVRMYYRLNLAGRLRARALTESPYPQYTEPLRMEGNALVLPDLEAPFHHADFVNRCIEVAQRWGVNQLIVAGDVLHLDSISAWEANWMHVNGKGGLDASQELKYIEFIKTLGKRQQQRGFDLLEHIGGHPEDGDPNVSEELRVARRVVYSLSDVFERVDYVMGNHDGRLLKALASPMFPDEILTLLKAPDEKWRIAPYYYSYLESNGELFRIEHPKTAAKYAAEKLAAKYHAHVLMGHSHALRFTWDISGKFYAIQMGACVDETRLPYAAQRSTPRDAHALGAVLVFDGYPWLLHEGTPWKRLNEMV